MIEYQDTIDLPMSIKASGPVLPAPAVRRLADLSRKKTMLPPGNPGSHYGLAKRRVVNHSRRGR